VGCKPAESIVYGAKSFVGNTDQEDPRYNTKLGMYEEGCGLENLLMTWSHDEYMYQVDITIQLILRQFRS
jgi:inositol oxygenase